jgi:hypothetical protein
MPIQIKRNSRNRPAAPENKVVNKVIAPKVTNDAAILSKKGSAYFVLP